MISLAGKTVCVVDAYGLIYQVFHAPGMEMTNAQGEPTGAAFGFVRDVLGLMRKLSPDYLLCAYDLRAGHAAGSVSGGIFRIGRFHAALRPQRNQNAGNQDKDRPVIVEEHVQAPFFCMDILPDRADDIRGPVL